jgi:phosphatidylglycerol lysyltransferase
LGYSIGNSIGISAVSGGAVRYRIYAAFGLDLYDVAAISSYIALAMGLGTTIIGVVALAFYPQMLASYLPFSSQVVQGGAIVISLGMMAVIYGLSFWGQVFKIRNFNLKMPNPKVLSGQIVITTIDVAMAAFALWILLPQGAPDFWAFLAIYAAAVMIGVLSHVPGGVGVFETVVVAAMPRGISLEETAAALVIFRCIYYLLPFALAFLLISFVEARRAGSFLARAFGNTPARLQPLFDAMTDLSPILVALLAFGLGGYFLFVSISPEQQVAQLGEGELIAAILREGGSIILAVGGVLLLILSNALIRRISAAFWLSVLALGSGAVASLFNGLDFENAMLFCVFLVGFLPFRASFDRRNNLTTMVFSAGWFALLGALILSLGLFFILVHQANPYSNDLWTTFSKSASTPRALRAGLLASIVLLVYVVYVALLPHRDDP